ncbi:MAG: hypothetical protein AB8U44_02495, partial [Aaplasma endosymbiont of Hyalomma asiaticum]
MLGGVSPFVSESHDRGVQTKEVTSAHNALSYVKKCSKGTKERPGVSFFLPPQAASLDVVKPDVFLENFISSLHDMHQACSRLTSDAVKNSLRHDTYKIISADTIRYICYDLASQDT